ncbi:MAG: hypothetical protein KJ990_13750 [Proteobacteria bacterium]|nr:hypothetical protein [Pseudomonadota bacterium]MBU1648706.1 hypothetical protein [Pseudomonadota bacterium]MBU1986832.1 hypothetical protein [Pseudomonadota bacterium]
MAAQANEDFDLACLAQLNLVFLLRHLLNGLLRDYYQSFSSGIAGLIDFLS